MADPGSALPLWTLMFDRGHSDALLFELDGDPIYTTYMAVGFTEDFHTEGGGIWSDTGLAKAIDWALTDPCSLHETSCVECGPNDYVVASFVATVVCDENDDLLTSLASQVHPGRHLPGVSENDFSDLFTTEAYSVFEDSATFMADVASTLDCAVPFMLERF